MAGFFLDDHGSRSFLSPQRERRRRKIKRFICRPRCRTPNHVEFAGFRAELERGSHSLAEAPF